MHIGASASSASELHCMQLNNLLIGFHLFPNSETNGTFDLPKITSIRIDSYSTYVCRMYQNEVARDRCRRQAEMAGNNH
jgi:hypothetical protein